MSDAKSIPDVVRLHSAAEGACDIDAIMATVSDDPVWEVWPYLRMEGRAAVEGWYTRQIKNFYPRLREKKALGQWRADAATVIHETEVVYESYAGSLITDRALAFLILDDQGDRLVTERTYFGGRAFAALYEEKYRDDTEFFGIDGVTRLR